MEIITTIQSISGQNKRFASLGKESENIELDFNSETIVLTYKASDKESELTKIDAVVKACDESLLAYDRYRRLAAVETSLIREYLIANCRVKITNLINKEIRIGTFDIDKDDDLSNNFEEDDSVIVDKVEIRNGAYRSIYTMLQTLIPIWKQASPAIINLDDTLKLNLVVMAAMLAENKAI
ncbi:3682_t:CDS:2 [Funneliformis mosseae]|uniref:3682_t:CDS:1 n=1 Tax=Funneliformis mosseae TaxID=27381 RepID=A0A9N9CT75_FUNMO|nr:3682_t:CDS:2 [Funneliformis mosseae]